MEPDQIKHIRWTLRKVSLFRKAVDSARERGAELFTFDGIQYKRLYAEFLLQAFDCVMEPQRINHYEKRKAFNTLRARGGN